MKMPMPVCILEMLFTQRCYNMIVQRIKLNRTFGVARVAQPRVTHQYSIMNLNTISLPWQTRPIDKDFYLCGGGDALTLNIIDAHHSFIASPLFLIFFPPLCIFGLIHLFSPTRWTMPNDTPNPCYAQFNIVMDNLVSITTSQLA